MFLIRSVRMACCGFISKCCHARFAMKRLMPCLESDCYLTWLNKKHRGLGDLSTEREDFSTSALSGGVRSDSSHAVGARYLENLNENALLTLRTLAQRPQPAARLLAPQPAARLLAQIWMLAREFQRSRQSQGLA